MNVPAPDNNRPSFRTAMQCRGRTADGQVFLADVWFSTYRTSAGSRLAAMVVDSSEDMRSREEFNLHQLMAGSRILVGAVSHEIRNVCGAIAVVHQNLARSGALAQNKDFEALGTLILALEKIAAMELRQTANQAAGLDLPSLLEELRIIVEPALREAGIEVHWSVEPGLPRVWADRQSLMQVFLNLIKNSERAMSSQPRRVMTVSARSGQRAGGNRIPGYRRRRCRIRIVCSGRSSKARRPPASVCICRGRFMRTFRGDLRYEPEPEGSSFIVELSPLLSGAVKESHEPGDQDSISGRSRLVPGEPQPAAPGRT